MTYRVNTPHNQTNSQLVDFKPSRTMLRALLVLLVVQSIAALVVWNSRHSGLDKHRTIADDCVTSFSKNMNTPGSSATFCWDGFARDEQKV